MMRPSICVIFLACWLGHVTAYPNGPPTSACEAMIPMHGSSPQDSSAPYRITAPATYCAGKDITVTIEPTGSDSYKGVFVQARCDSCNQGNTTAIGTYNVSDSELIVLDCSGPSTAVSHNSRAEKTRKTFMWTPPSGFNDQIKFRATFVQTATVFWVGVESAPVQLSTGNECGSSGQAQNVTSGLLVAMLAMISWLRA